MVVLFQEKVDDLLVIEEEIDVDVRSLETCQFNAPEIKETLGKIQRAVDDLSLHQGWDSIQFRILTKIYMKKSKKILMKKLEVQGINSWHMSHFQIGFMNLFVKTFSKLF